MPAQRTVALSELTFAYPSSSATLFSGVSATFNRGFTGIVGANGAGKTTLLRLICGDLQPSEGFVSGNLGTLYCAQRTDDPPPDLVDFFEDWGSDAFELRGRFDIAAQSVERWSSLSHGERKRVQIAHALWQKPEVLAIDEPTNHLDGTARTKLIDGLEQFKGTGFIVSHDRSLLDQLCQQCLWIEPPLIDLRTGGYTASAKQRESEAESRQHARATLTRDHRRMKKETERRRDTAGAERQKRSKRGLSNKDSDGRDRINRAKNTDSKAGAPLRQLDGRTRQLNDRLADLKVAKTYETGIWLPGSRSHRNSLLELPAGSLQLAAHRSLTWPDLRIGTADRIVLTGPNGAGKTTFLNHILTMLNAPPKHIVFLPQELPAEATRSLLDEVKQQPKASLGVTMNIVSRLNSRPAAVLSSNLPSPGEARKLLLAVGMQSAPHIIVMDEPTNHLDLPSIEALQAALIECPCALILASHDETLIDAIGGQRWRFEQGRAGATHINPQR